jgi:hypothetical protein
VARAAESRGYDTRSHVVTEEPALQALETKPSDPKPATDESNGDDDDGEGDADDDEPSTPSADGDGAGEPAAGAASEGDEPADGDKRPKSRRARKTARLQKELAEARDRIIELESGAQAAPPAEPAKEPIADDFASWDEYAEAKAVYLVEQKVAAQSPPKGGAGTDGSPIPASWGDVTDKYSDFDAVAYEKSLQVNDMMVNQLIEMNQEGAEALYYLGKHPDEAKRIATVKGETAVARELAKIAVKAVAANKATGNGSQPPTAEAANVAPTVSNAPPPISATVGGGAQGRQVDLDNADPEEYRAIRRKQMAARG